MGSPGLPRFPPARTPRSLWIELTSKCPFDCVFCSRKVRRGAGEHLPFPVYEALLKQLVDPRRLVLNYSGESTVYPDLIPAIQLARSAGAYVELVSAMAPVPESMLAPLSRSGLNRLTVSVHATEPAQFLAIYRHSSFETLRARLERLLELCGSVSNPPLVDLAFVAMDRNLGQLAGVAAFARSLGLAEIMIFPVMRRDEIPVRFPAELDSRGLHRPEFEARLKTSVDQARSRHPDVRFTICNATFAGGAECLGQVPMPYAGVLPAGACVHSCEQNPWETAHVLANGDVVACEVLDKKPLGNLLSQSLAEIWEGAPYREFRRRYLEGEVPECRSCPWKKAYRPAPLESEIIGLRGRSAQLVHGWHDPAGEPHVWSSQQALALLAPRPGANTLHVSGVLPPGPDGDANELAIRSNGADIGRVANPWPEPMPFGLDFPASQGPNEPLRIEFRTRHVYRPSERGGADQRDLGFALHLLASKQVVDRQSAARRKRALRPLPAWIRSIDLAGRCLPRRRVRVSGPTLGPGISVVIPERENPEELGACLESLREAAARFPEPVDATVVVNGSPQQGYQALRRAHPAVQWRFHTQPLGFAGAVAAGLRDSRFDWVYLLNNDVALDRDALCALAPLRAAPVFGISSQVFLKDPTRFREETNWGALLIEDGLATIHDWIPRSDRVAETFYPGGGASLFQTRLLCSFLDSEAYAPFYWEDVEWGWRARKQGYRCLVCPASVAHHRQRATIGRCYTGAEIEAVLQRNRLLFHLRNLTSAGSLERVMEELAQSPGPVADFFQRRDTLWTIARGRLWNHRAPLADEEVLRTWERAVADCR